MKFNFFKKPKSDDLKNLIGVNREEIFTYKYNHGTTDKALVRIYYRESKNIVVISPINTCGFQNIMEYFLSLVNKFYNLDQNNALFIEHRPEIFGKTKEIFAIMSCEFYKEQHRGKNGVILNWNNNNIDIKKLEEMIECKFENPHLNFMPTYDYEKILSEMRFFLISSVYHTLRNVDGIYDFNYNIRNMNSEYEKVRTPMQSMGLGKL